MPASARPRRSALYMPGSNPRALEKGRTLMADVLILDLEDAVAPDAKDAARTNIATALAEGGYGKREILVRVNALDAPWGRQDLADLATCGADGILLPKVESADAVRKALSILDAAGGPADLAVWCMIETPMGVLHAEEIAAASPRMAGFRDGDVRFGERTALPSHATAPAIHDQPEPCYSGGACLWSGCIGRCASGPVRR